MEKITKKQMYEAMREYFLGKDVEVDVQAMYDFCGAQIADLDKKAAKAKERAAAKRAESDELTDAILGVMTEDLQTVADLVEAVAAKGYEDVSAGKVTARVSKLIDKGAVVKEQISIGEGKERRKCMSYKLVVADEAGDEE